LALKNKIFQNNEECGTHRKLGHVSKRRTEVGNKRVNNNAKKEKKLREFSQEEKEKEIMCLT